MDIQDFIVNHDSFKEDELQNRFFKHHDIELLLKKLPSDFAVQELGKSVKGKNINLVSWGKGGTKIMLWSQMHGDEATGTMAIFDLFNFLQSGHPLANFLAENCQLFFIPMVNPDGATAFTRRNAQQIDINRDFLKTATPEAKILKDAQTDIQPHFGFNLHDQLTLWSVTKTLKPATLSFLAPAFDEQLGINETRKKAMLVIAQMFADLHPVIPGCLGLFDDAFEPRAFGDNFQKAGTSTILIEAGGYQNDFEKQQIRKFYFGAIVSGLQAIASKSYEQHHLDNYFAIPKNNKQIFHILIHGLRLDGIEVSVGINYDECPAANGFATSKNYVIQDIGDLSYCDAYDVYAMPLLRIKGEIKIFADANFSLLANDKVILAFSKGKLIEKSTTFKQN